MKNFLLFLTTYITLFPSLTEAQIIEMSHIEEIKIDSLVAIERKLQERKIPVYGYAYTKTAENHADFDPLVAAIQLDQLISCGTLLTDQEATAIKLFHNYDLDTYFDQVLCRFHDIWHKHQKITR